jgi:hypothetical protein
MPFSAHYEALRKDEGEGNSKRGTKIMQYFFVRLPVWFSLTERKIKKAI